MNIGTNIKELRIERGLSQAALAKAIGVSQKAIDYWERGINEPKASFIVMLSDFRKNKARPQTEPSAGGL